MTRDDPKIVVVEKSFETINLVPYFTDPSTRGRTSLIPGQLSAYSGLGKFRPAY